jgi:predicted RNA-binding protein with TRAM domain
MDQESNLPVRVGEEYDLEITEASKTGADEAARVRGLVVFVKKGKVGQKVRVKIKSIGTTHAVSEIV